VRWTLGGQKREIWVRAKKDESNKAGHIREALAGKGAEKRGGRGPRARGKPSDRCTEQEMETHFRAKTELGEEEPGGTLDDEPISLAGYQAREESRNVSHIT